MENISRDSARGRSRCQGQGQGQGQGQTLVTIRHLIASALENERRKPIPEQRRGILKEGKRALPLPSSTQANDDEDEDSDVFSDALSQTEAWSVSVVSDINNVDDSGSVNAEARSFIMDRFLPAAKAMASESTQHSTKRPPAKSPTAIAGPLPLQSRPFLAKGVIQDDDDDGNDEFSFKACGFFSWRLKHALSHVYHSPRRKPSSPLSARKKMNRHCDAGDHDSSSSGTDEEGAVIAGARRKNWGSRDQQIGRGSSSEAFSPPGIGHALMNRISYQTESPSSDKSRTPNRGFSSGISPYRNETPISPFNESKGFLGFPRHPLAYSKFGHNMNYLEGNDMGKEDWYSGHNSPLHLNSESASPTVEKSCYAESLLEREPSKVSDQRQLIQASTINDPGEEKQSKPEGRGISVLETPKFFKSPKGVEILGHMKAKYEENCSPVSVLPPPLPKSPSESWLWRAIPLVTSPNSAFSPCNGFGKTRQTRPEGFNDSFDDAKWETT
eukprot:Gb_21532 [translate_table: standard]